MKEKNEDVLNNDMKNIEEKNDSDEKKFEEKISQQEKRIFDVSLNKAMKILKKNNYEKIKDNYTNKFLIHNIKTGVVLEINAASSYHACNLVGWKSHQVKILNPNIKKLNKEVH
jgi:hypothetical protein